MDAKFIRENLDAIKDSIEKRGMNIEIINNFMKIDNEWRSLKKEVDLLRGERNRISLEINKKKKEGKDVGDLVKRAKEIPSKLKDLEEREKELLKRHRDSLFLLPNLLDQRVPLKKPKVLRTFGKPVKKGLTHYDLIYKFDLVDTEKAGKLAGSRFYIEKNELVFLDIALTLYALKFFREKGFENVLIPPYMIKKEVEERVAHYDTFKEAIFHVKEDDLLMITTSEHPIAALYQDETIRKEDLPLRVLAFSPAFRREAGSHGKDTKGIFRVKQFHKVELHTITDKEGEEKELNYLLEAVASFIESLDLPYRLVILPANDMDKRAKIQYDFEIWFGGSNEYRETHSIATVGEWISRKIHTKIGKEYAINLYATGVAIQRTLCAILENFYDEKRDVISIPKVLWPYLDFKEINLKKK